MTPATRQFFSNAAQALIMYLHDFGQGGGAHGQDVVVGDTEAQDRVSVRYLLLIYLLLLDKKILREKITII
jgi:hypothetical protein